MSSTEDYSNNTQTPASLDLVQPVFSQIENADLAASSSYRLASQPVQYMMMADSISPAEVSAQEIQIGASVSGQIKTEFNDDFYRISLQAGQAYQIDMQGQGTNQGTLADPFIKGIYNSLGQELEKTRDDDGGEGYNARLIFIPEETGDYYIQAGGYHNRTGSYQFTVSLFNQTNTDDFGIGQPGDSPIGQLSTGVATTGNIETTGDMDGFQLNVRSGYEYQIDIEGISLNDPLLVGLYDSSVVFINGSQDDDGGEGLNARYRFEATTDDTLYLAVSSANSYGTGTYTVTLTEETPTPIVVDDRSSNIQVVGSPIVIDSQALTGDLETARDEDWYQLTVTQTGNYRVDVKSLEGESALADPRLTGIYNSKGEWILGTRNDDGGVGLNARLEVTLEAGDYFIGASGLNDQTGQYSVSVTTVLPDDYTQDTNTSGQVTVGESIDGRIEEENDKDWLKVSLEANNYYQIDVVNISTNSDFTPVITNVYAADGEIAFSEDALSNLIVPSATADYFIEVSSLDSNTGSYEVSVSQPEDIQADKNTSGVLVIDQTTSGTIDFPEDEDWFKTSLQQGNSYHISLEGSGLNDPLISGIYNSSGILISNTFDDDNGEGLNAALNFSPSSSGNYFVAVQSSDTGIGGYDLNISINPSGYDDLVSNKSSLGVIKVGGSSLGTIEKADDKDWFKMSLVAGTTYLIGMEGSSTGKGTLSDPLIDAVFDRFGLLLGDINTQDNNSGDGKNALLTFTPTKTDDYFVSAKGYYSATGTYMMTLAEQGETTQTNPSTETPVETSVSSDDFASDKSSTGVIEIGGSTQGNIEKENDKDWFKMSLVANKTYVIGMEGLSSEQGTLVDPFIDAVYDRFGLLLGTINTQDNNSGYDKNALLTFTPTKTDDYFVSAKGYYSSTGTYAVTLNELQPDDYGSSLSDDVGSITVGSTEQGQIEQANDKDWFKVLLNADQNYTISLSGTSEQNSLYDPYIYGVYNSDGGKLLNVMNNDANSQTKDSAVTFSVESTDEYYISVTGNDMSTGDYILSIV